MPDGKSWLLRPVKHNMCLMESLKSGALDLMDIADMNDYLDTEIENNRRWAAVYGRK